MKASINWIKDYLPCTLDANQIADKLTMAGLEVQGIEDHGTDSVIEVEITSNRPDWLSHLGIAREVGAIVGKSIVYPTLNSFTQEPKENAISVEIKNESLCPFYSAILLENVEFGETPQFIVDRLKAVGLRSINLPVDLTNYILLEYGQPLHAFDHDLIGSKISVRNATDKERFMAINDKEYALHPDDLVICDENGVIALAGVMGGQKSEVSSTTKNILLESAFFNPVTVRGTSRRLLLVSDSSYRFERTVDPGTVVTASDRFVSMMIEYGKVQKIHTRVTAGSLPLKDHCIDLPYTYVQKVLGHQIPTKDINAILTHLEVSVQKETETHAQVCVPSFRQDLERPIDLVEEIARIYGYDRIPETYPRIPMIKKTIDPLLKLENKIQTVLSGMSLNEIITFSLESRKLYETFAKHILESAVSIINPSNKELNVMRPSLINGMMGVVKSNINTGNKNLKFFELGRRYKQEGKDLPVEEKVVSLCISGEMYNNWMDHSRQASFYDLKGVAEQLLLSCGLSSVHCQSVDVPFYSSGFQLTCNDAVVGCIGKIHNQILSYYDVKQDVFYAEISIDAISQLQHTNVLFKKFSKYPASYRDISIVVPVSVHAGKIIDVIKRQDSNLIKSVELYDRFTGKNIDKGSCSLTFAIEFQSDERTLSHEEIDSLHTKIINVLVQEFQAVLR